LLEWKESAGHILSNEIRTLDDLLRERRFVASPRYRLPPTNREFTRGLGGHLEDRTQRIVKGARAPLKPILDAAMNSIVQSIEHDEIACGDDLHAWLE